MAVDPLENRFKKALRAGQRQIGFWCTMDGSVAVEIAAGAGYDWLLLDTEHTPTSDADILHRLQIVAGYETAAVVRPAWNDRVRIKRLLDIGAQTLLIPYVESAEEAAAAVDATRYPPQGSRGVAGTMRASRFGSIPQYQARAGGEICVLVQIESRKGLDNLEAIAAVDGVDGVFVGPADLAANCGLVLPRDAEKLDRLLDETFARIAAAGRPSGILTTGFETADRLIAAGAGFVAVGVDAALYAREVRGLAKRFKG
ncbi:HpcH/HpaI aldolase family protein [Jiella sonneratiae]|uniref:4-hydroxy-2-oxo-heptane-1,7-dioate aldolase n=1 Tax=Jiella sonneratiae TaxID=2816856 RepID=A0ABS3J264_9HYPH|nr:aldolase/citrate lyase family protein [Jiella sonneratiae]MBO0903765.1 4-hydroxy-2-oxo-heptane-1,7-dioate aldolase [Jiella sonneratiae]